MTEEELKDVSSDSETSEDLTPETADELPEDEAEAVGEDETLEGQLAQLETRLAEAEQKTAEYLDGWQRAQAAFANFRKRNEMEQAQWRSMANERLLLRLLPVLDDFKRAFEVVPDAYKDAPWLDGIRLIERKVYSVVESENAKAIELEPGDSFDPNLHEAVLYQEVDGFDEGEIVTEIETGYLLGDRVLRPALVVVAKAPPAPPVDETAEEPTDKAGDA